ncbi:MAG: adenylosuccinate synthetase [Patescibacteria group bacterium]|jgi:adenylosuccinate synthase
MAPTIYIVTDLTFGDGGKGTIVDALARHTGIKNIVRFNGGSQAAHNVITPQGLHHCFAQFGSGMLLPDTHTIVSRYMLINPSSMLVENSALQNKGVTSAMARTFISENSAIITPWHELINQMREIARGNNRHGSCGKGVWEATCDLNYSSRITLFAKNLDKIDLIKEKIGFIQQMKLDIAEQLYDQNPAYREQLFPLLEKVRWADQEKIAESYQAFFKQAKIVTDDFILEKICRQGAIFEGAQGVLLDADYGFHPYVTSSNTTMINAEEMLKQAGISPQRQTVRIGVMRGYMTRHGAGPLVTEDQALHNFVPPDHNEWNDWQQDFRLGWFDLIATKYALSVAGKIDALAITNLDRMAKIPLVKVALFYRGKEVRPDLFISNGEDVIVQIRKPALPQQNENNALTNALFAAEPVYFSDHLWTGKNIADRYVDPGYIKFLEERLGVPVKILSFGPTAKDKLFYP